MKHKKPAPQNMITVVNEFALWLRDYVDPWVREAHLPRHQDDQHRRLPYAIVTAAENFDKAIKRLQAKKKHKATTDEYLAVNLSFIHEIIYDKVSLTANKNPVLITALNKSPTKAIDIYSKTNGLNLEQHEYVELPTLKEKTNAFYNQLLQCQKSLNTHPTLIEKMIVDWMDDHDIVEKQQEPRIDVINNDIQNEINDNINNENDRNERIIRSICIIVAGLGIGTIYGIYSATLATGAHGNVDQEMEDGYMAGLNLSLPLAALNMIPSNMIPNRESVQNTLTYLRRRADQVVTEAANRMLAYGPEPSI